MSFHHPSSAQSYDEFGVAVTTHQCNFAPYEGWIMMDETFLDHFHNVDLQFSQNRESTRDRIP